MILDIIENTYTAKHPILRVYYFDVLSKFKIFMTKPLYISINEKTLYAYDKKHQ